MGQKSLQAEPADTAAPPEITFVSSLPLNVLLTLALVPAAEHFAGLDGWLGQARAALPAGLLAEIALLTAFPGGHLRFVEAVAAHAVGGAQLQAPFSAWAAHLAALPPAAFQAMALHAVRRGLSAETVADADLLDPLYLHALLAARDPEGRHGPAVALVLDPAGLQARFLAALTAFWEQLYAAVYEERRPLLERSAAGQRARHSAGAPAEVLRGVVGREMPAEVLLYLPEFRHIRFVPSWHLGRRAAFFRAGEVLTVFYGAAGEENKNLQREE